MIRVGPAGWSYPDWEGIVYPRRKPRDFHPLRYLARFFDCVEINSSFYAAPNPSHVEHWVELVADQPSFRFTAKLQDAFTHEKLELGTRALAARVRTFHEALAPLDAAHKLSAVLAQFPQSFQRSPENEARLVWIAETFGGWPLALELRHRSWFAAEPLARVRELGYTLADIDLPAPADRPSVDDVDAAAGMAGAHGAAAQRLLSYSRLHGRNARAWFDPRSGRDQKYDYLYGPDELRDIVHGAQRAAASAAETFVITNNHFTGKAVVNALEILAALKGETVLGPIELVDAYPRLRACVRAAGQGSLF